MSTLQNKVAVITGGNSGIGYATAEEFISRGAKVIITGRNRTAVEAAAATLGNGTLGITADQGRITEASRLAGEVEATYGKVDVLFVNAGIGAFVPVDQVTEAQFDETMNINFKGAFFTVQKFLPLLNDGASIILLSSVNAFTGMPGSSVYSASKAALNSLGRTLSRELASRKIRVNVVNPGPIVTPILAKAGLDEDGIKAFHKKFSERIPLSRPGESSEVAKLVAFLASSDASFITGAEYNIDGGLTIHELVG
ncbi:SDR family oxidoreductase [Chitinophaga lutea]|uniref:SDR family oxidoreductase n=1 Tax=Chitinophaga lutea TaxID=2488634 RepID=A0A3N4PJX9_9BACT|nr:SDR family oxidoreductase [Chitinophaga lutea]RPE08972.1 SDR family oxidoreductase [Chitinophaga lutea]